MAGSHRFWGCLMLLAVVAVAGVALSAPEGRAASDELEFVQPAADKLSGLVDLRVTAPAGTTAVRFYMDDVQLSELTDLYAEQTETEPVWKTATDAGWFKPGRYALRAEADTPDGTVSVAREVVVERSGSSTGPGSPGPSTNLVSLTGGWRFAAAADLPSGALEGDTPQAAQPGFDGSGWPKVMVPNSIGAVDDRWNSQDGLLGVYRKTVEMKPPRRGERADIVLESCYWSCRVFVNGTEVGGTVGGYLPGRFDVTDAVRPGENLFAVVVDNRLSTMGSFSRLHSFYWNWGGIMQEIYVERTPEVALVDLRAEGARDGTLTLRPTGVNATGSPQTVEANVEVVGPDGRPALEPRRVNVEVPAAGGGGIAPVKLKIENPELWDLEDPNLYTVRLKPVGSPDGGELIERTGFRDVEVSGSDVLLNGEVVENLQGFNRHADYPGLGRTQPDGLARREMERLYEKGFRIFRPAHYPTTPAELDAADELGILTIEEINVTGLPGAALGSPQVKEFGARQLTKMIQRDRSHPSIIGWSVGNENLTEQEGAPEYVRDTIALGRSLDPTRLYTQVTHRGTNDRTYQYQDFVAHNYYAGWYTSDVRDVVRLLDSVQRYSGDKPIMLSEYGAEAVVDRPGTGKGTEFYQGYIVDEHNRLLDGRAHFLGKMYWTSTEFWCRPDWAGGNPDPVPPFHTKALRTLDREKNKLAWRVMFSPVRIEASVLDAPAGEETALEGRVVVRDVSGEGAKGTVVVEPPEGFVADPVEQGFQIGPGGQTTVEFALRGTLPGAIEEARGLVRAVVDSDTEAQPAVLTVRRADTVEHPASDDFEGSELDDGWTIIREEPSGWSLEDRPGSLRLSTLPGGETESSNAGKNLFLREDTPGGDFTAVADVEADVGENFQQIGLYAYRGDDDYAKIALGHIDGRLAIEFLQEAGARVTQRTSVAVDSTGAKLRLVRRGDTFHAEYSTDGVHWLKIGEAGLSGVVRVGLQAAGGRVAPPVVPTYVDKVGILVPGRVSAGGVGAEQPLFGGRENAVEVLVSNSTGSEARATATAEVPEGWASGSVTQTIAPFDTATLKVPVTPAPEPSIETITARVTVDGEPAYGSPGLQVISVPPGDGVPLALDSGSATSPLVRSYSRLSPVDAWDPADGYGWVGTPPSFRDRGELDDLRRDFTLSRSPATLRVAVPAGKHTVYLLCGDASFSSGNTIVSSEGRRLAELSGTLPRGEFRWLKFELDGGEAGRTVDLTVSGENDNYWRLNALVMMP